MNNVAEVRKELSRLGTVWKIEERSAWVHSLLQPVAKRSDLPLFILRTLLNRYSASERVYFPQALRMLGEEWERNNDWRVPYIQPAIISLNSGKQLKECLVSTCLFNEDVTDMIRGNGAEELAPRIGMAIEHIEKKRQAMRSVIGTFFSGILRFILSRLH